MPARKISNQNRYFTEYIAGYSCIKHWLNCGYNSHICQTLQTKSKINFSFVFVLVLIFALVLVGARLKGQNPCMAPPALRPVQRILYPYAKRPLWLNQSIKSACSRLPGTSWLLAVCLTRCATNSHNLFVKNSSLHRKWHIL